MAILAELELSDRLLFVLCMCCAHTFTFVYDVALHVVRTKGWFKEYELQKPRPDPDEKLVRACLLKNLRNHMMVMPAVLYYFAYDAYSYMGMRTDYASWQGTTWTTVGRDLLVSLALNDTGFYWAHRALHTPWLYKNIHKQHHQFKQPIASAAEWAHPLEDAIGNIGPTLIGCFLMGSHMYVTVFWLFLRLWKSLDAHSGYSLPFPLSIWHGLPGMLGSDMHDFHHESKEGMNSCFGAMTTFWDSLCGTDKTFYEVQAKKHQ